VKILTVLGTRPEIIRLSRIIEKLDAVCEQVILHTGQNFDPNLNEVFFEELGVRQPNHILGVRAATFGEQLGAILAGTEKVLCQEKPDKFLVLGDTNSSVGAIIAKRLGIPVYHMEAGNRCYDDRVPEEVNRRVIDHSSDVLLPYSERSRQNLLAEGIPGHRIYVTGNPIYEVTQHYAPQIDQSDIFERLGIRQGSYLLVTMHRAENVDVEQRLRSFISIFEQLRSEYGMPVIVSTHPRTRSRMESLGLKGLNSDLRFLEPFGFFDFVALEKHAFCVLSDSGTVQEECAILGIPNVTIRDVTERPETLECGSSVLTGADLDLIPMLVRMVVGNQSNWKPPVEYVKPNVSDTVVRVVTSFLYRR
jgi:UDP-N-acetylglucosamine 2-epimerase (non-hydrolysing)